MSKYKANHSEPIKDSGIGPLGPEAVILLGELGILDFLLDHVHAAQPDAQEGMEYAFNTHRMFFDRVMAARLYEPFAGSEAFSDLKDDQLYRVVTGMYSTSVRR